MERPLLLLMTMDTAARTRLAVTLGFSLVHRPLFGQPAAEAAQLLFRKQQGVQVRGSGLGLGLGLGFGLGIGIGLGLGCR